MRNHFFKLFILLLFFSFFIKSSAQEGYLTISGKLISKSKEELDGVRCLIIKNSKVVDSLLCSKKGLFAKKLKLNQQYVIELSKKDYTTKKIIIDTEVPKGNTEIIYFQYKIIQLNFKGKSDVRSEAGLPFLKFRFSMSNDEFISEKITNYSKNNEKLFAKKIKELETELQLYKTSTVEKEPEPENKDSWQTDKDRILKQAKISADSIIEAAKKNALLAANSNIYMPKLKHIPNSLEVTDSEFKMFNINRTEFENSTEISEIRKEIDLVNKSSEISPSDSLIIIEKELEIKKKFLKKASDQFNIDKLLVQNHEDSLLIYNRGLQIEFMEQELGLASIEVENMRSQLLLKKAELNSKNTALQTLGGGLFLLLILLWITFRSYRLKKKNSEELKVKNKLINDKNAQIKERNNELHEQNEEIAMQKKEIVSSINAAKRIQNAILPTDSYVNDILNEHFIFFRPRNIVSGDFYWMKKIDKFIIIVAADCTGHGVPGAFMSMLGVSFLNEVVKEDSLGNTGEILNRIRNRVKKSLHQKGDAFELKDGMDMAFYTINTETLELQFSGAFNPLYILREQNNSSDSQSTTNTELIEIKADRQPVAVHIVEKGFTSHKVQLMKNDSLYTFSDGFIDQFGGGNRKKYRSTQFKNLILSIQDKPMKEQKIILENTFDEWKGKIEQMDDVLVLGIKV